MDYEQRAIVTVTELQRDHKGIAYERFLANGAIAMLPLSGQRSATIWTAENQRVTELLALTDTEFTSALQTEFGYRLGRLRCVTKRQCYPLQRLRAHETQRGRVLLIGNAAHTVHPIAAQGLNLAIYEVAAIADYFEQHHSLQHFSMAALPLAFSQQLSHRLSGLFAAEWMGLSALRQMGMVGLDACLTAKRYFIERAIGKHGRVPVLLLQKEA
jgi:2-octaprenyl-6-methoxyphenol hydroxylase